jgi:hypothetical protein
MPDMPGCQPVSPKEEIRNCTESMSAGSIACREGKTPEQVCSEDPSISGCSLPEPPKELPPIATAAPVEPPVEEEDPTADEEEVVTSDESEEDGGDGNGGDKG